MNIEANTLPTTDVAAKLNEILNLQQEVTKLISALIGTLVGVSTVSVPTAAKEGKLASQSQLRMLFAIRKKHDIPDAARAKLLKGYGINQEADLQATQVQAYRSDLLALAKQFNPHYPIEKFLANGTLNPEWKALNGA